MDENNKCNCCSFETGSVAENSTGSIVGEYVCYCNKVTENDIVEAINEKGATSVDEVIRITGAMVTCNCKVNNPKGVCCYPDIVRVFDKHKKAD